MNKVNAASPFTTLERFSLTAKCTTQMMKWNHAGKCRVAMKIAARIVGCVAVIFAVLTDLFIHHGLTLAKALVIPFAIPLKICLRNYPSDLDLSSPIVHLKVAIDCWPKFFLLPILIVIDPDRAYRASQLDGISQEEMQNYIEQTKNELQRKHEKKIKDFDEAQKLYQETQKQLDRLIKEKQDAKNAPEQLNQTTQAVDLLRNDLKLAMGKLEELNLKLVAVPIIAK